MSKVKIYNAPAVKNMPWQERPEGEFTGAPIWRYKENPIIGRNPLKGVARIFNSAVIPYGDEFIGVFRGEQTNGIPYIYMGHSKDAIHWMKTRLISWMRTASHLCRYMRMIPVW